MTSKRMYKKGGKNNCKGFENIKILNMFVIKYFNNEMSCFKRLMSFIKHDISFGVKVYVSF